jgi:hypothetical protein
MKKVHIASLILLCLSVSASAQELKHFPVPPQFKDQKAINHLADLEGHLKAIRKSELQISFTGWSNPDIQAAAERHSQQHFQLIEKAISKIDDIRAGGSYSIRELFSVYSSAQAIEGTAESLANQVFEYKHDGQLGAEILGVANDLMFSLSDIEQDILSTIDLQGDMLMTLQTQPPCKE